MTFMKFTKLYRMLTRYFAFIYTPDTVEITSLLEFTLPAVTLRRTEGFILWNIHKENYFGAVIIQMGYSCLYFLSDESCWLFKKLLTSSRAISEIWYKFCDTKFQIKRDGVYVLRRDSYLFEQLNLQTVNSFGTKSFCVN